MISSKNVQIVSQLLAVIELSNDAPDLIDALEFRRDQYGLSKAEFACVWRQLQTRYNIETENRKCKSTFRESK